MRSSSAVSALRALCAVAFTSALVACGGETGIIVEVSSPDLAVPADVDALRFEAVGELGVMAQGVFPIASAWPHSLAIRPRAGEESGTVNVQITGLKGGIAVATTTASAAFRSGETVTVTAVLSRCVGAGCMPVDGGMDDLGVDLGQDLGVDAGEPFDAGPEEDLGGMDGGVADLGGRDLGGRDLGSDLGPVDLGRIDLGAPDLGPADLGMPDLGSDMGSAPSLVGSLVISEMSTGRLSGTDEFVELYNRTDLPLAIGGVTMEYRSNAGAGYLVRATIPAGTMLAARSFYLIGSVGYTGAVVPDLPSAWTSGFASSGGHVRIAQAGMSIDLIGWGPAVAPETTAVMGFSADASRSYERKAVDTSDVASMTTGGDVARGNGHDTDNNALDFIVRPTRDPQNAASATETP